MTSIDTNLNWDNLGLSPEVKELIKKAGYNKPSPVQAQSIPIILEGHDILVSSQTGSGKTASFVLPAVEKFKNKNGTYILALAPTREIAQQTGAVFESFAAPFGLKTVVCIGGASMPQEKEALSTSPDIIVATPGRLCDHLERGNVWLDFIQCLIFDEADRMLDMGFAKQIQIITEQIPKERQTLMFSATFAPSVEKLARDVLNNPKTVTIEKTKDSAPKIDERLYWMDENHKTVELLKLVRREPGTVIVFVNAKEKVYRVWRSLANNGIEDATYIHSDITQEQREAAIADFKSGKFRILIATDVVGRGIDVDDVAHVVNFDIPREADDYVHRIGRTGRQGKTGKATSFAIPVKDEMNIRAIEKMKGIESPPLQPKSAKHANQKNQHQTKFDKFKNKKPFKPHDKKHEKKPHHQGEARQSRPHHHQQTKKPLEKKVEMPVEVSKPESKGFLSWVKNIFTKK
jgi:ATP-dependent RNA helicase RhlE